MEEVMREIERVASELITRGKFPVVLGGEHSITPAVVAAVAAQHRNLSVLQLDAHADLRDSFMGTRHSHGCAMRRTLEHARCTQVGVRSLSAEEAAAIPSLRTTLFYDYNMRRDPAWMDRVVDSLSDNVYITIDVDGFDPAIMPATGTPEPGGLSWYEGLTLLRKVIEKRNVVAWDIVELSPIGGNVAQSVTAKKLNLRRDLKFSAAQQGHCGGSGAWALPQASGQPPRAPGHREKCSLNDKKWFVLLQLR
jgi:agmatinase